MRHRAWALLAVAELKLLIRSPLVAATAILAPLAMGLFLLGNKEFHSGGMAALQLLALIGFTPYAGATTTLTARRQQLVLKRLRTSPASDREIIAGILAPLVLLVVVQSVVLLVTTSVVTDSTPRTWWPLVLAVAGGTALGAALAFATAAITSTPEMAQVTTLPVFLALFAGGIWVGASEPHEVTWAMVAVPGGAVAQLVRLGWDGTGLTASTVVPAVVAMVVTVLASVWLASRVFRWQPRT
jgi:ABC-2 type transport system permease protein